jgi:hypothetical protein
LVRFSALEVSVRLYLAGGEAWYDTLLHLGVKNILFSYYYFREMYSKDGFRAQRMLSFLAAAQKKGYSFMLDSGAYTYQAKAAQPGNTLPEPASYFHEYKTFLEQHGHLFDIIVEFDIDHSGVTHRNGQPVVVQDVDRWTNELLVMPTIGPRIMPVYHAHRGEKWLLDWLAATESPFVGISSSTGTNVGVTQAAIAKCHLWGKFVHGFAQTRIKTELKFTDWDSVDSTTWLRADKYGGTCIFRNDKFIVLDHKHKADRAKYRDYWEAIGLDFSLVMKDDLETMRKATIIAWRELANFLERQGAVKRKGRLPYLLEAMASGLLQPGDEHPKLKLLGSSQ